MNKEIRFIDLFAGMGGTRIGLEQAAKRLGLKTRCVLTSEIKPYAIEALKNNFGEEKIDGDIRAIDETQIPDFYILPSKPALAGAEIELIDIEKREFVLRKALQSVIDMFDYVLIDCPPSLNLITINALVASSSVIIPLQCEFLALEGLADLMKNINQIKRVFNSSLKIQGIVLTMYDKRNNLSAMVENDVRQYFGDLVYQTLIPRSVRISEATSHGKPILIYDFKSVGAQAYISLAKEVLKREKEL